MTVKVKIIRLGKGRKPKKLEPKAKEVKAPSYPHNVHKSVDKSRCERVKAARKALGMMQREVADLLQVATRTVERWEAGERTPCASVVMALENEVSKHAKSSAPSS